MKIDYDDIKVSLCNLIEIADMALNYDEQNKYFATLSIIVDSLQHLTERIEKEVNHG